MTKKYTNFFLSALLALCVITGCDDKDDDAPAITVSSNSVTILAAGGILLSRIHIPCVAKVADAEDH